MNLWCKVNSDGSFNNPSVQPRKLTTSSGRVISKTPQYVWSDDVMLDAGFVPFSQPDYDPQTEKQGSVISDGSGGATYDVILMTIEEQAEYMTRIRESMACSPWQMRKALDATGDRDAVEAAITSADRATQDAWEYATQFERLNHLVLTFGQVLGKTEVELDALFELAVTL